MTWDYVAQPKEVVTNCNLCGSDKHEAYAAKDRYGLAVTSMRCQVCGLVFLSPRMTTEAYAKFYQEGIYRDLLAGIYGPNVRNTTEPTQTLYGQWLTFFLREHLENRAGTLLDVGGSSGRVANMICKTYRFVPTVLEPSAEEIAIAKYIGLETIQGSLETWDPAGRMFDVALLCQTVDHLMDIKASLRKIRGLLSSGGLFFVDISDYRTVLFRTRKRERVIKVDHPFYLTPQTMEMYLHQAWFRIVDRAGGWKPHQQAFLCEAI